VRVAIVRIVNLDQTTTQLPQLVDEEFIITRDGRPVAHEVPIRAGSQTPRIGFMTDTEVPDDVDRKGSREIARTFGVH
jgi:antitoxin (DNA-binding transcriptional repressor) of toxin-antitoxin stability system